MILQFNPELEEQSDVNRLIEKSVKQTNEIVEYVNTVPTLLTGHFNLRNILRSVKRGYTLDESIKIYAGNACPPNSADDIECEKTTCENCWKYYIEKYKTEGSELCD